MSALLRTSTLLICLGLALPFAVAAEDAGHKKAGTETQAQPAIGNAPSTEETAAVKPPKVEVADGRLSVDIREEALGDVLGAIANAAGFDLEMSTGVFEKKLTTRFRGIELERGLMRLLTVADQKNYTINYRGDGSIKELAVFGDLSSGTQGVQRPQQIMTAPVQQPARSPGGTFVPSRRSRSRRPVTSPRPVTPAPSEAGKPEEEEIIDLRYRYDWPATTPEATPEPSPPEETPNIPETGETEPPPGPGSDGYAEEIIPEGEIPPESSLLNAPNVPPSGPPAIP